MCASFRMSIKEPSSYLKNLAILIDSLIYNPIIDSYAYKFFWPVDKTFSAPRNRRLIRANGHNIAMHQLPTVSGVTCCVLLRTLLHVFGRKFETDQTFEPTFLLFRGH